MLMKILHYNKEKGKKMEELSNRLHFYRDFFLDLFVNIDRIVFSGNVLETLSSEKKKKSLTFWFQNA